MKRVLWFLMISVFLFAEKDFSQNSEKLKEKDQGYDVNSQWFKERMYFNRADWDTEEKKIFEEILKEKKQEQNKGELYEELAVAFAQRWAACSMREKFRTQKGSLAIEKSEKYGKEMKKYWDEIYDRCDKARWRYYRLSKSLKKQQKQEKNTQKDAKD